jgi:hypothetical protein
MHACRTQVTVVDVLGRALPVTIGVPATTSTTPAQLVEAARARLDPTADKNENLKLVWCPPRWVLAMQCNVQNCSSKLACIIIKCHVSYV